MKHLYGLIFSIAMIFNASCAEVQKIIPPTSGVSELHCTALADLETRHLLGLWRVSLYNGPLPEDTRQPVQGTPQQIGTLLFESHPDHSESLRGTFKLQGEKATHWLSGDLDEGELILDESEDGQRISAIWVAHPTAAGCGRELRGNRRLVDADALQTLVMTRIQNWR